MPVQPSGADDLTVLAAAPSSAWRVAFETLEDEIPKPRELEVDGSLPTDLAGTLYRIGPARHDVYGERYRHWFDGDGMVHALQLEGGRAHYCNRFVATTKKQAEDNAGRRLSGGFGTPPPGGPWTRLRRAWPGNTANTNVVDYGGRLLALWEGGRPWRLDPVTLDTVGEDDLRGVLGPRDSLSAHPHLDPATGQLWNFGVHYGARTILSLYRTEPDGTTLRVARLPLPLAALVHDFALTATKVVVVVVPMALPRLPLGFLTGWRSYGESLRWRPEAGTQLAVVDRASHEVWWYRAAPFMMFHTINAWDDGDTVTLDVCAYPDGSIMRLLAEVMTGEQRTRAFAWPERLRLTPGGTVERQRLTSTTLEFPRVATPGLTREHRRLYGVAWTADGTFVGVPVAVDLPSGTFHLAAMRTGEFAGEGVPVAKTPSASETDVWLLTIVLDALERRSELRIFDGGDLSAPPVARVRLPHAVPVGFHGNWIPSAPDPR